MIKIENVEVFGWDAAIRGMRNPMNSWEKSDSYWTHIENLETLNTANFQFNLGENDLKLMRSLSRAGSDHAKFLRMIDVTVDITAPLYWWKEFDTYKVGTVANSCSTMHTIHKKRFTLDDFSHEDILDDDEYDIFRDRPPIEDITDGVWNSPLDDLKYDIGKLNLYLSFYRRTGNKKWWRVIIQRLPSNYNQKRTVQLNYQVLKAMYFARKDHKLTEWVEFCKWCETLPYFHDIVIQDE